MNPWIVNEPKNENEENSANKDLANEKMKVITKLMKIMITEWDNEKNEVANFISNMNYMSIQTQVRRSSRSTKHIDRHVFFMLHFQSKEGEK